MLPQIGTDHVPVGPLDVAAGIDVVVIPLAYFRLGCSRRNRRRWGATASCGEARVCPGAAGATRRGVTTATRSVSFCLRRDRDPSTGTAPVAGSCGKSRFVVLQQTCDRSSGRPGMDRGLCASRRVRAGIVVPEMVTALLKSSSLTEGSICKIDGPARQHGRTEPKLNAEFLEFDGRPTWGSRPPVPEIRRRRGIPPSLPTARSGSARPAGAPTF